ncbi:MAG: hypothetical protein ACRERD_08805 [Candidatus Binatia bacterium]
MTGKLHAGYFNFEYDDGGVAHAPHGWGLEKSMAGVRVLGKTGFGGDFTLNYLFKRAEHTIYLDAEELFKRVANIAPLPASQIRQAFKNNYTTYTPVYRSMMGFDLVRSLSSFPALSWMKYAPWDMGTQITFFTFQFLTEYQLDNFSNNFPSSFICTGFELQNKCNR